MGLLDYLGFGGAGKPFNMGSKTLKYSPPLPRSTSNITFAVHCSAGVSDQAKEALNSAGSIGTTFMPSSGTVLSPLCVLSSAKRSVASFSWR